jgi:hypothetical protein
MSGQYLGYGLQAVRLCFRLLTGPQGSWVSIEHDDDVSVRMEDGSRILEQDKSSLKGNPLTDFGDDLWKTIAIWIEITDRPADGGPAVAYHLYVAAPKPPGAFALAIHEIANEEQADAFLDSLQTSLKNLTAPPACKKFLDVFLAAPLARQRHLLINMSIEYCGGDPVDAMRKMLELTVAPETMDQCCDHAIGSAKRQSDRMLRRKEVARLSSDAFRASFRQATSRVNMPALLPYSAPVAEHETTTLLASRPVFIRQLEFVQISDAQKLRSVSDYLRASTDKTNWAATGLLEPETLDGWKNKLIHRHTAEREEIEIVHGNLPPEKRGALVYQRICKVELPLDFRAVESYFIHGCFHDLSDRQEIGWHPDYLAKLSEEDTP